MSREYIELSSAYSECLRSQIALGARLVGAIDTNMLAFETGRAHLPWTEVKDLQHELRAGRRRLQHLRKRIKKLTG